MRRKEKEEEKEGGGLPVTCTLSPMGNRRDITPDSCLESGAFVPEEFDSSEEFWMWRLLTEMAGDLFSG